MVVSPWTVVRCGAIIATLMAGAVGQGQNLTLRVLSPAIAAQHGAACLDGTPPGYYYRLGDPSRWKIHLRGGGWCFSAADCASRAKSDLGSSLYFLPKFDSTPNIAMGFMDDAAENAFGNWSFAFVQYCDGSSWTSGREAPLSVNDGTQLYFRGSANIAAIVADLEAAFAFVSSAQEVVLSGTSAGGLATILTADRWQALLRPSTRFAAIVDSGFFLNYPDFATGQPLFAQHFAAAVSPELWNATAGTVQACVAAVTPADAWTCFFPEVAFAYTPASTRLQLVQSMVDQWSVDNILSLPCTPTPTSGAAAGDSYSAVHSSLQDAASAACTTAELAALSAYANATQSRVLYALNGKAARARSAGSSATDGAYLTSCFQHGATCSDPDWFSQQVDGTNANVTAWRWYSSGDALLAIDSAFPSDATCQYSAPHGWC
jgi:hypothetical protein